MRRLAIPACILFALASVLAVWACSSRSAVQVAPMTGASTPAVLTPAEPPILSQPILPEIAPHHAARTVKELPPGDDPFAGSMPAFNAWNDCGAASREAVDGMGFDQAFRVVTRRRPELTHALRHTWTSTRAVAAGQPLLLDVSLKGVQLQSAAYVVQAFIILRGEGEQIIKTTVNADAAWKRFRIAGTPSRDLPVGKLVLEIHYGVDAQELLIGGVAVQAYPTTINAADLPSEGYDYAGRASDAPWRQEAARRIEQNRTQVLTLQGTPGAIVRVRQLRHAFSLGTALSTRAMLDLDDADAERYRSEVRRLFTQVTFEGEHKWPNWENPKRRVMADRMMTWCRENGLAVYGHTLVWGGWKFLPERLKALENKPEELRTEVRRHITEQATALAGQVIAWDVVNEPYTQGDLLRILGRGEAAEWYRLAQAAAPGTQLALNDYEILDTRAASPTHRDYLETLLRDLLAAKAPVMRLGFQGHMYPSFTPPEELWRLLDRFAAYGLPISITEHDINTSDEQLQADYARDFLLAVMAHPAVDGITLWGFWDGSHWKGNALLYRKDWSLKPAGKAWLDLLRGQWWTDREVTIGPDGSARLRVWKGVYRIGESDVEIGHLPVVISK
jgi:endo-1,4-beta-xylanase